ncbi:hypothetical protein KIH74_30120 [Kineosporia sp. J2-2]|uniref:Uncharacterized protein n=1 Tax=Kineosporia corallincola TaxID=2835133 RepID=A0ABS5TQ52_9ACTN|nr:hypothetical protein [Kineosporia corallincola]MBT0773239.1 hypothetical protein [Kineosporia corallincola]
MLRPVAVVHLFVIALVARLVAATEPRRDERGSVTLEQVVIALGLFLLAVAVIAGIKAAVDNRIGQIN